MSLRRVEHLIRVVHYSNCLSFLFEVLTPPDIRKVLIVLVFTDYVGSLNQIILIVQLIQLILHNLIIINHGIIFISLLVLN